MPPPSLLRQLGGAARRGVLVAVGCSLAAWAAAAPGAAFVERQLPAASGALEISAWVRPARQAPSRYRVIVLPGSGCRGWAHVAEPMFAGLAHAELWLLHKPLVRPWADTPAQDCLTAFVQRDRPTRWLADAQAALTAIAADPANRPILPTLLVGISEGADLLPHLAAEVPALRGLVMIGSAGLDPGDVGELQSRAQDDMVAWRNLQRAAASARPDADLIDGRSLGYWRDLLAWRSADALLQHPIDLLSIWGTRDEAIPQAAYRRFAEQAWLRKPESYCQRAIAGADHGLRSPRGDELQVVWADIERWAETPEQRLCRVLDGPPARP